MAKPAAVKTKKKIKRVVTDGIAHVHASFNNTIVTITDRQQVGDGLVAVIVTGEVGAVTLESRRDERAATFEVARDCGNGCASQRVSLPDQPPLSRVVPIAAPSLATRLGQELAHAHRDPSYEASLQVARALVSR